MSTTSFRPAQTSIPHNAKLTSSASPIDVPTMHVADAQIGDDSRLLPHNPVVRRTRPRIPEGNDKNCHALFCGSARVRRDFPIGIEPQDRANRTFPHDVRDQRSISGLLKIVEPGCGIFDQAINPIRASAFLQSR
ncbi:hypothetical protein IVB27_14370 [Bradyrhizobium sp. 197]|uniref:hypothetical protein n=1 Tax=Bradyrhizobium sp. 197 TaxID=2782663 RepID=UPI001FFB6385|nr:hypothetical protein [Bradyrhizobium sp. 197]MCK1475964.1 hypothetical protein [Bradyrhizobium sp. 197]